MCLPYVGVGKPRVEPACSRCYVLNQITTGRRGFGSLLGCFCTYYLTLMMFYVYFLHKLKSIIKRKKVGSIARFPFKSPVTDSILNPILGRALEKEIRLKYVSVVEPLSGWTELMHSVWCVGGVRARQATKSPAGKAIMHHSNSFTTLCKTSLYSLFDKELVTKVWCED